MKKTHWSGLTEVDESDVRGYFPCCPICGSKEVALHLTQGGRDTLSCESCRARWHIYVGVTGLKWAELDVESDDGKGKELLGKRLDSKEWQRMAQHVRRTLPKTEQSSRTKDDEVVAKSREIVREKEVIVKVRCPYCQHIYDETSDKCPHCGGKR